MHFYKESIWGVTDQNEREVTKIDKLPNFKNFVPKFLKLADFLAKNSIFPEKRFCGSFWKFVKKFGVKGVGVLDKWPLEIL